MKQTNNAIKFLMAQYRAIFKNANLKMFLAAATAAAAMAAGSAQAANTSWEDLSGDAEVIGSADNLTYSDKTDNSKGFTLTVNDGSLTFTGTDAAATTFQVTGGKTGSIVQNGGKIALGSAGKSGTTVSIESFKTTGGELVLGDAQASGDASVLNAKTITIGGSSVEGEGPAVTVGAKGQLGGADTTTLSIQAGTVDFTDNVKAKASTGITISGGTVTGPGNGKTLTLETPKLDVAGSGKLIIGQGSTVKVTSGAANEVSLAAGTVENQGGTLDLGDSGSKLSLATTDFNNDTGIFANKGKITATGATAGKAYAITLNGEGTVDLGMILTDAGAENTEHMDLAAGDVSLTAKDATVNFSGSKIAVLTSGTFAELEAGKDGALTIDKTALTIGKKLTVPTATEGEFGALTIDNAGTLTLKGTTGSVEAKSITVGGTGKGTLTVAAGDWTAQSLIIKSGTATVEAGTSLVVSGGEFTTKGTTDKLTVKGVLDASTADKVTLVTQGAELAAGGKLILDQADVFKISGDTVTLNTTGTGSTYAADAVAGNGSTVLQFNSSEAQTISAAAAGSLKGQLTGFSGLLQFGGNLSLDAESIASGEKAWADVSGTATILGANDNVTLKEDELTSVAALGNIKIKTEATKEFTVKNTGLTLSNASANITEGAGKFVMDSTGATAGLKLSGAGSSVTLNGAGEIGSINGDADGSGSVLIGSDAFAKESAVVVSGGIGDTAAVGNVTVNGKASLTINAGADKDALVSHSLTIEQGGSILAEGQKITIGNAADKVANIKGNLETKTLTLSGTGTHTIAGNAVVTVETLTGTASGAINVGQDNVPNGSATVKATNLVLNGAKLNIDPDYGQHYASTMAMNLSGTDGNVLDGLVNVGKNSVFAVGFEKAADVDAALGDLIANGSFNDPTPPTDTPATVADPAAPAATPLATNALVLNKAISIDKDKGGLHIGRTATTLTKNNLIIDSDGAVVITDAVYSVDPATGKKTGDAITMDSTGTVTVANGATVYLVGSFNGADDNLSLVKGPADVASKLQNLNVKVGSDLLDVVKNADGTFDISLTTDKDRLATAFTDSATPVRDLLLDVLDGHKIPFSTQAGYKFLDSVAKNPGKLGAAADAAAHAATYAGAQQAAVASVTTMAEAVGSRIGGLGVEATAIQATGSQANGGVWLTPMYKTVDADGFGAQGATYGADVDLAGVAFGTDTVNGNMRFGAVFNIGSGDADGKGNGNGLKDEFDYYGFGMYSVMGFGNFALVGDASLNVISHDVEGLGLKGEADTTAVTMGVTGQYTISNPMVDVTPHLGARFIRLDTDSYDLTSADGVVANTDFEVQNVFSVPLGVTLSKAFEMGGWALAPSADLSITFNTGDTDVESSTYFTGARAVNLTTEVLDEVTYGVALGLGAQYGAFGTAINVNYSGSENTDAFGVNAQARYMF